MGPKKYTKNISFLLILSILSINLAFLASTREVKADLPVIITADPFAVATNAALGTTNTTLAKIVTSSGKTAIEETAGNLWDNFGKYVSEEAMAFAARKAAILLIQKLTDAMVDWINSGFQGQPAFVADPGQFLRDTADQTVGDMIFNDPALNFLCSPFQMQVKVALGLNLGAGLGNKRFQRSIGCTLSDVVDNAGNAIDSASVMINGKKVAFDSWDNLLASTQNPQNNVIGAFLLAKTELDNRTVENKDAKKQELSWGQGALSYQECTVRTTDKDGKTHDTVVKGTPSNVDTTPVPGSGEMVRVVNCVTKTPGSTVTSMINFKATNEAQISTIQAATANGLDNVLSALMDTAINFAISKLTDGLLGGNNNNEARQNYEDTLSDLENQSYQRYRDNLTVGTDITDSRQTIGLLIPPRTQNSSTTPGTNDVTISNYNNGYGAESQARNNAITLINSLLASESAYQTSYGTARNVLVSGRNAFATSTICNINYNRNNTILRASLIRSNVLINIDGVPDSNRTVASIPWNLPIINAALVTSNSNISILNRAISDVNSTSTVNGIATAMTPVNSTSFNTDPQAQLVPNIKTWLSGATNMYDSTICPINIAPVLQINSASNTPNLVSF